MMNKWLRKIIVWVFVIVSLFTSSVYAESWITGCFDSGYTAKGYTTVVLSDKNKDAYIRIYSYDILGVKTSTKLHILLRDTDGNWICEWDTTSGTKLKLGRDHSAYRVYIAPANLAKESKDFISTGNNFTNTGACCYWAIKCETNCDFSTTVGITKVPAQKLSAMGVPSASNATTSSTSSSISYTSVDKYYKVVDSTGLNLRQTPNGKLLTNVPKNTSVHVTRETKSKYGGYTWGYATYNGKTGWLAVSNKAWAVQVSSSGTVNGVAYTAANNDYKIIDSTGLNLRQTPNGKLLVNIPKNKTVRITRITKSKYGGYTWGYTSYNGKSGWIVISNTAWAKRVS